MTSETEWVLIESQPRLMACVSQVLQEFGVKSVITTGGVPGASGRTVRRMLAGASTEPSEHTHQTSRHRWRGIVETALGNFVVMPTNEADREALVTHVYNHIEAAAVLEWQLFGGPQTRTPAVLRWQSEALKRQAWFELLTFARSFAELIRGWFGATYAGRPDTWRTRPCGIFAATLDLLRKVPGEEDEILTWLDLQGADGSRISEGRLDAWRRSKCCPKEFNIQPVAKQIAIHCNTRRQNVEHALRLAKAAEIIVKRSAGIGNLRGPVFLAAVAYRYTGANVIPQDSELLRIPMNEQMVEIVLANGDGL